MKIIEIDPLEPYCNVCGNTTAHVYKPNDYHSERHYCYEYAVLEAKWGYHSNRDLEHHKTIICEKCYEKVVEFINSLGGKMPGYNYFFHIDADLEKELDFYVEPNNKENIDG